MSRLIFAMLLLISLPIFAAQSNPPDQTGPGHEVPVVRAGLGECSVDFHVIDEDIDLSPPGPVYWRTELRGSEQVSCSRGQSSRRPISQVTTPRWLPATALRTASGGAVA